MFLSCRTGGVRASKRRATVFHALIDLMNAGVLSTRCANDCLVALLAEVEKLSAGDVPALLDAVLAVACGDTDAQSIVEGPVEGHALDLLPALMAAIPDDFLFSTAESNSVLAGSCARGFAVGRSRRRARQGVLGVGRRSRSRVPWVVVPPAPAA